MTASKQRQLLMARPAEFHERAIVTLDKTIEAAWRETDPEDAVRHFTRATQAILGDPEAPNRPGALKPGEKQLVATCTFVIAPSRDHMILFADYGFPPTQRHARISVTDSRPGHTVQTKRAAVVPNTDEDKIFRQIMASARVGCTLYVPMMWRDQVIGMFNTAAQARYMYDETDLIVQKLYAAAAAAAWMGLGGPILVERVAASLGPWPSPQA